MDVMRILKLFCLLLAVVYGYTNIIRSIHKQNISSGQILLMGIGIVGFLALQFGL